MTRPMIRIHDISTDKIIDREMNDAEFAQYEADKALAAEYEAKKAADAEAKAALLARLGITESEAQLLLGGSN